MAIGIWRLKTYDIQRNDNLRKIYTDNLIIIK